MTVYTQYEKSVVHPAVKEWLNSHKLEFSHEVAMPVWGIADFVATSEAGIVTVIEAKGTAEKRGIAQVLEYKRQIQADNAMLAIPMHSYTDEFKAICDLCGVDLLLVDCPYPTEILQPFKYKVGLPDQVLDAALEKVDCLFGYKSIIAQHKGNHPLLATAAWNANRAYATAPAEAIYAFGLDALWLEAMKAYHEAIGIDLTTGDSPSPLGGGI